MESENFEIIFDKVKIVTPNGFVLVDELSFKIE
jgi:hypothetical protein